MDPTLLVMEQDSSKGRIQFVNYDNVTQRNTRLENNGHTVQLNVSLAIHLVLALANTVLGIVW